MHYVNRVGDLSTLQKRLKLHSFIVAGYMQLHMHCKLKTFLRYITTHCYYVLVVLIIKVKVKVCAVPYSGRWRHAYRGHES